MSVFVKFKGGIQGNVSDEVAQSITQAYGEYTQDHKRDVLIGLPGGKQVRISSLDGMETVRDRDPEPLPIESAMQKSAAEEKDETKRKLKDAQIKIFRHNKQCLANRKMDEYIWYYTENGKIYRSTQEELKERYAARDRLRGIR